MDENEWKKKLSKEQFYILRKKGTEQPFTGKFYEHIEEGTYICAGCGAPLFDSDTKYDSGCGWPSFFAPIENGNIVEQADGSHGMIRTEVLCKNCGGHLGHVFPDGPKPSGIRYCINSASLEFEKKKRNKKGMY